MGIVDSIWRYRPMIEILSSFARKVISLTRTATVELAEPIHEWLNRSCNDSCGFQYRVVPKSKCSIGCTGLL